MLPSPYFTRQEFACKCGCGFNTVDAELLDLLTKLRKTLMVPIIITSGCRCRLYNHHVGGVSSSQHTLGRAADIISQDVPLTTIWEYLNKRYTDRYGFGRYDTFIHVDTRSGRSSRW